MDVGTKLSGLCGELACCLGRGYHAGRPTLFPPPNHHTQALRRVYRAWPSNQSSPPYSDSSFHLQANEEQSWTCRWWPCPFSSGEQREPVSERCRSKQPGTCHDCPHHYHHLRNCAPLSLHFHHVSLWERDFARRVSAFSHGCWRQPAEILCLSPQARDPSRTTNPTHPRLTKDFGPPNITPNPVIDWVHRRASLVLKCLTSASAHPDGSIPLTNMALYLGGER